VLVRESIPALKEIGWGFFTDDTWDPVKGVYGALAFIYGTVVTSAIAMLIAVPLGVGTAAYLSEIAPGWFRRIVAFLVELLAAIPSVVYGFWGMFVLAPLVQVFFTWLGGPNVGGRGILSCSLILSIMIVPYVTAVSFDVCRAVPSSQRQAALALGANRWQTIWTAVLPYARPGIAAACFIALGRALGETMAATMLIGNKETIDWSVWALGDTIASKIANTLPEASGELYRAALIQLGLILFVVTTAVNAFARLLIWRMGHTRKGPSLFARLRSAFGANDRAPAEPAPHIRIQSNARTARAVDRIMTCVLFLAVCCTIGPLFFILGYLIYMGVSSLNWAFFTELPVPMGEPGGGMANAIYGSAMLVGFATAMAVPIGLFAAIYLAEYRNGFFARSVRFVGELLGGVPSIVIGIYGYVLIVLPMARATRNEITFSAWAGAFALGVMMIPIVLRASEEAMRLVPRAVRNASMALGANTWQTIVKITLPAALPAIVTAIFLSIARVAGETAPLLLTAADNRFWPTGPSDWIPSIPVMIFNYSKMPFPDSQRKAWAAALVLMALVLLLNFGIRWVAGKRVVLAARAD
jgi:phosphate transport system permease protein